MDDALTPGRVGLWGAFNEVKESKVPEKQINYLQGSLINLEKNEDWKNWKKIAQRQADELNNMVGQLNGTETPDQIGFKFMACKLAAMKIEQLINMPESQRRALDATGQLPKE